MSSDTTTSFLLESFQLRDQTLSNRVIMAPLTRSRAGESRVPNDLMAEYYTQRASAGLIISEATTISPQANGWVQSPGVYTEEMTQGWKKVVDSVHKAGGKMFLQLWHMGRASHSDFHEGGPAIAPSSIAIDNGEPIRTPSGKKPHQFHGHLSPKKFRASFSNIVLPLRTLWKLVLMASKSTGPMGI